MKLCTLFTDLKACQFMIVFIFWEFICMLFSTFRMNFRYLIDLTSNSHLSMSICKPTSQSHSSIFVHDLMLMQRLISENENIIHIDWTKLIRKFCKTQLIYLWNVLETLTSSKEVIIHSYNSYLIQMLSFICSLQQFKSCEMLLWHSTWCIIELVQCSAESHISMKEGNDSLSDSVQVTVVHTELKFIFWLHKIKQTLQQMSYWLVWTAYSKVLLMSCTTLVASLSSCCIENLRVLLTLFHSSLLVQFDDLCLLLLRGNFSVIVWSNTFKTHDNDQRV
jgi:hypothetical protein